MKRPVTKSDVKLAKKHVKMTVKLEKKKIADHVKAAKKGPAASRAYNKSHAAEHKKDIRKRQNYAKSL